MINHSPGKRTMVHSSKNFSSRQYDLLQQFSLPIGTDYGCSVVLKNEISRRKFLSQGAIILQRRKKEPGRHAVSGPGIPRHCCTTDNFLYRFFFLSIYQMMPFPETAPETVRYSQSLMREIYHTGRCIRFPGIFDSHSPCAPVRLGTVCHISPAIHEIIFIAKMLDDFSHPINTVAFADAPQIESHRTIDRQLITYKRPLRNTRTLRFFQRS